MPHIRIVNSGYKSTREMQNLLNYIVAEPRHETKGLVGGNGILVGSAQEVYTQMMEIKRYYQKTDGYMLRHIFISLSEDEMEYIGGTELYIIGMRVCNLFPRYQSLFAIHFEKKHLHLHIAINTVSYVDGRKLQLPLEYQFHEEVEEIISHYLPQQPIIPLNETAYLF